MTETTATELIFCFPDVNDDANLCIDFRNLGSPEETVPLIRHPEDGVLLETVGPVVMHLRPQKNYPFVVLVTVGGRNALTGQPSKSLSRSPQNYFSSPPQGGIDGYYLDGQVHPFRAGAEAQLNTTLLQIKVFPMKKKAWDYFMFRWKLIPGPGPFITGLELRHGGERQCEPVYEDLCSFGDWDQDREETAAVWLRPPVT